MSGDLPWWSTRTSTRGAPASPGTSRWWSLRSPRTTRRARWAARSSPGCPASAGASCGRARASEPVVWHAHRNNELLWGLALRRWAGASGWSSPGTRRVPAASPGCSPAARTAWSRSPRPWPEELQLPAQVVGHGIDLARFVPPGTAPRRGRRSGWEAAWAWASSGGCGPRRGRVTSSAAVAPLLAEHPEWRAVLVGAVKAPEQAWAERLRAQSGGALHWQGERPDVERWYRGLTVMVQPSHTEGYSMALLEAMASGCCVVAARLPVLRGRDRARPHRLPLPAGRRRGACAGCSRSCSSRPRARGRGRRAAAARRRAPASASSHEARALTRVVRLTGPLMRILHLLASPFFSGPAENVALLALAQARLGHEVRVAVDRKRPAVHGRGAHRPAAASPRSGPLAR